MKRHLLTITFITLSNFIFSQEFKQKFNAQDIEIFWEAYDKITSTKDTLEQQKLSKNFI